MGLEVPLLNGAKPAEPTVMLNGVPTPLPVATFAMLADVRDLLVQIRDALVKEAT